jgi:hypothetical protein
MQENSIGGAQKRELPDPPTQGGDRNPFPNRGGTGGSWENSCGIILWGEILTHVGEYLC